MVFADCQQINYTDRLAIEFDPDITITFIVPYPPDDWQFDTVNVASDGHPLTPSGRDPRQPMNPWPQ